MVLVILLDYMQCIMLYQGVHWHMERLLKNARYSYMYYSHQGFIQRGKSPHTKFPP